MPAAWNARSNSDSTSCKCFPLMAMRAIMTICKLVLSFCLFRRYASRRSRRARLRVTALPTLRLVTTPRARVAGVPRRGGSGGSSTTYNTNSRPTNFRPCSYARRNCRPCWSRSLFGNVLLPCNAASAKPPPRTASATPKDACVPCGDAAPKARGHSSCASVSKTRIFVAAESWTAGMSVSCVSPRSGNAHHSRRDLIVNRRCDAPFPASRTGAGTQPAI
jgi:hypothetical protein